MLDELGDVEYHVPGRSILLKLSVYLQTIRLRSSRYRELHVPSTKCSVYAGREQTSEV